MPAKDKFTFPITFKACSLLSAFHEGACIHAHLLKLGFASDVYSLNALLYLYCKCGRLDEARQVFDRIPERSVASWSAMIAGYDHNGEANKALELFVQMRVADALVDDMAIVSVVSACTECGCLKFGESVHAHAIVNGILSIELSTAFVDMYAKCGAISTSREVFNRMPEKNVLSWSAMMGGLAMHGSGKEALALFIDMLDARVKPNSITFTHILSACGQNGMVDEGQRHFDRMKDEYWIKPRIEHYGCMVDLLSRAGLLDQALDFIAKMPMEPTEALWRSLLGSACTHGNLEIGELAMNHLAKLEPIAGDYVTLANLYAQKRQWEKVGKVRNMMCDLGVKKVPGYSLIEVNGVTHKFVVWDRYHPQTPHIYDMLGVIHGEMSASWDQ
eukprot:TRINITY_DN10227_c1_g1_i1.p1 TRINITY_DN10227_c1_g1~~TRINITY_DN10227_c1_g1_i1.p1  ORF type:complete len:388 (-),score=48.27 TRINITY_DN10227_c1_g1_i1:319-1482(-)